LTKGKPTDRPFNKSNPLIRSRSFQKRIRCRRSAKPTTPAKCFPPSVERRTSIDSGESNRKRHYCYNTVYISSLSSASHHINGRRDEHSIARAAAASRCATAAHPRCQSLFEPHQQPKIPRPRATPSIHISDPPTSFTMPIHSIAMHPDPLQPRALAAPHFPRIHCVAGHERPLPSPGRQ